MAIHGLLIPVSPIVSRLEVLAYKGSLFGFSALRVFKNRHALGWKVTASERAPAVRPSGITRPDTRVESGRPEFVEVTRRLANVGLESLVVRDEPVSEFGVLREATVRPTAPR